MSLAETVLPIVRETIVNLGSSVKINKYGQSYIAGVMQEVLITSIDAKCIPDAYKSQEVQGSVQVGDMKLIIANDNFTIDIASNKVEFLGEEYNIINSMPLVFQDTIMIYELQVRK